jgi:hypothetical protein
MCVKCGISNCGGCSGKDLLSGVTGDIVYDGDAITCVSDGSIDITSGEKLNSVIQKIMASLCEPLSEPFFQSNTAVQQINSTGPLGLTQTPAVTSDGDYLIRYVAQITSQVYTIGEAVEFKLSITKNGGGLPVSQWPTKVRRDGIGVGNSQHLDNIVMESIVPMNVGDTFELNADTYFNSTGLGISFYSTIYMEKVS